jgi:predicted porin
MKKALVLSAIAATLAAPAFAQSSVTLYGRLNLGIESQKIGNTTDKGVFDNASRFGFKGVEDLGGGLKAGFQLESGFNAATGKAAGTFWGRQSEANLAGNFGMIRMGRFTSEAYFASADYVSMHNHDTGDSNDFLFADANGWNSSAKVAYRTPAMGGLTAELAVQNATANGANPVARGYDFATNYDGGPLHLGLGYTKHDAAKALEVRGLYELGAFTFGGYVQRATDIAFDNNQGLEVSGLGSRTTLRLSGMYTVGATELHLNVGKAGNTGSVSDSGATQYTLGVNQNLSKRTKLFGYYTKTNNQANGAYATGKAGVDLSAVALGIRHNF